MACKKLKHTYTLPATAKENPYKEIIQEHTDLIFLNKEQFAQHFESFDHTKTGLNIDFGCGAGNFIRDVAKKYPHTITLGVEIRYKRLVYAALKLKKHALQNAFLLQGKAQDIIHWLPKQSLQNIFVNFPDPWLKRRQQKNRMLQPAFLDALRPFAKDGARFYLKTDNLAYYQFTLESFKLTKNWEVLASSANLYNSPYVQDNIPTEFEQIFSVQNLPIHYVCATTSQN